MAIICRGHARLNTRRNPRISKNGTLLVSISITEECTFAASQRLQIRPCLFQQLPHGHLLLQNCMVCIMMHNCVLSLIFRNCSPPLLSHRLTNAGDNHGEPRSRLAQVVPNFNLSSSWNSETQKCFSHLLSVIRVAPVWIQCLEESVGRQKVHNEANKNSMQGMNFKKQHTTLCLCKVHVVKSRKQHTRTKVVVFCLVCVTRGRGSRISSMPVRCVS